MDIRFRYLNISDGKNHVSGIALCYNKMEEADILFEVLMNGFGTNISQKIFIKFDKNKCDTYNMDILIKGSENLYKVELEGIDSMYVEELKKSIKINGYIFIVTAQSNKISEFNINKKRYCCVSEFYVDNKKVDGNIKSNHFVKELVEQFVSN